LQKIASGGQLLKSWANGWLAVKVNMIHLSLYAPAIYNTRDQTPGVWPSADPPEAKKV